MKIFYQCETCGKKFTKVEDARCCEKGHEEQRIREESLAKEKKKRASEIETLIQKYLDDYREIPNIRVSGKYSTEVSLPQLFFGF